MLFVIAANKAGSAELGQGEGRLGVEWEGREGEEGEGDGEAGEGGGVI